MKYWLNFCLNKPSLKNNWLLEFIDKKYSQIIFAIRRWYMERRQVLQYLTQAESCISKIVFKQPSHVCVYFYPSWKSHGNLLLFYVQAPKSPCLPVIKIKLQRKVCRCQNRHAADDWV